MTFLDFAVIKQQVPIRSAIDRLGLTMTEHAGQWRGPCPACNAGGKRALVVTPAKNAFYCFAAHGGGDVIALVAHIRATGMKEAASFLVGESAEPESSNAVRRGNPSDKSPEERSKEAARSLQPLSYLEPEHDALRALGLDEETCRAFGAGYAPKGIMRGRLAIPIHDWRSGELVAYCGRTVRGESPELIFPNGFDATSHVFNGHRIEEGECILMRDPLEVMIAAQNGIDTGIALLTDTIVPEQLHMLAALMDEHGIPAIQLT